jgi:hypothetical protein
MYTWWEQNAFVRRDYLVTIPIIGCWLHGFLACVRGNAGTTDWIGGMISLCLISAMLFLAAIYSSWALWLIPGFLLTGLAGATAEVSFDPTGWSDAKLLSHIALGSGLWSVLTGVVWFRYLARKRCVGGSASSKP